MDKLGFALCGSFCSHVKALDVLRALVGEYDVVPIVSERASSTATRFGEPGALLAELEAITGHKPVTRVEEAEEFGPSRPLDALVVCPLTGNSAAKLAHGITDTAVTMAAKAHLRSNRPLLLALASNDAMSANLSNIGVLLNRKNVYFVPMKQDDPVKKPHSLVADFSLVLPALEAMKRGEQLRPLFL
ncbi:MAG: dipicolinate synthase subunit B [Clostridia bacterium]|nr:dipicolinate synthase subunit B [Clostridia bacterium]